MAPDPSDSRPSSAEVEFGRVRAIFGPISGWCSDATFRVEGDEGVYKALEAIARTEALKGALGCPQGAGRLDGLGRV